MLYLIILYKWVGEPTGERTDNLNNKRPTQFIFFFQIFLVPKDTNKMTCRGPKFAKFWTRNVIFFVRGIVLYIRLCLFRQKIFFKIFFFQIFSLILENAIEKHFQVSSFILNNHIGNIFSITFPYFLISQTHV